MSKMHNSINLMLEAVPGVTSTNVNLNSGEVKVTFADSPRPSPADLVRAVEKSGFTMVGISTP